MKDYHWIEIIIVSLICSFIMFMCHSLEAHDCDWPLSAEQCEELRMWQYEIIHNEKQDAMRVCYKLKMDQFSETPRDFTKLMMFDECFNEIINE